MGSTLTEPQGHELDLPGMLLRVWLARPQLGRGGAHA
jgi:hypothetical protein